MGFDPTTTQNLTTGIGIASDLYGIFSEQSEISDRRDISQYNKAGIDQEVKTTLEMSALKEARYRKDSRNFLSANKAAIASQGGDINTGSALDILADQAADAEMDAAIIQYEGQQRAAQLRRQGINLQTEANILNLESRGNQFSRGSSILTGLSQLNFNRQFGGGGIQYDEFTGLPIRGL